MSFIARLPVVPELPTEAAYLRANRVPDSSDLGTCVRLTSTAEEGVVIEVVPRGQQVRSLGVKRRSAPRPHKHRPPKSYVVQCWDRRLVKRAGEMIVVAL